MSNTKVIKTRIQNKVDLFSNWQGSGILLNGEIATVRVDTRETFINPITGIEEPKYELLMKIGNGTASFNDLPWLSAKAADVYDWAKVKNSHDLPIVVIDDGEYKPDTLGSYLQTYGTAISDNAAAIEANSDAIASLLGTGGSGGTIAERITAAIEALDGLDPVYVDESNTPNNIVKAVTQVDGKIQVTFGRITKDELPVLDTSDIAYSDKDNLKDKLDAIDTAIEANADKLEGIDETVVDYVNNTIGSLDLKHITTEGESEETENFVTAIAQEDGQVSYTTHTLPTVKDSEIGTNKKGIVAIGYTGGAASHDAVFGTNGLSSQVESNAANIESIRNAIAGGVHFIGVTTTELKDGGTAVPVITGKNYTALDRQAGDIVLYKDGTKDEKEFIWTGSVWEELGDLTRIGALETLVGGLNEAARTDNQFVTHIYNNNGVYEIKKARPTSSNISHADASVADALDSHDTRLEDIEGILGDVDDVADAIESAINGLKIDDPESAGNTKDYKFISSISLADGEFTVTKHELPTANADNFGVVMLSDAINHTTAANAGVAATPYAVNQVLVAVEDVDTRVEKIAGDYVRFAEEEAEGKKVTKLYAGTTGVDMIIFDCGDASDVSLAPAASYYDGTVTIN